MQQGVEFECRGLVEFHVVQARRGVARGIGHQFHQQHALEALEGLRHPHTRGGETVQRIDLGVLPGFLGHLAPVAGALAAGARLAAVLDPAAFLVGHGLAEVALLGVLVDLGAANLVAAADHVDRGLLAAHQLAGDFVDQAFFGQRNESGRDFHRPECTKPNSGRAARTMHESLLLCALPYIKGAQTRLC